MQIDDAFPTGDADPAGSSGADIPADATGGAETHSEPDPTPEQDDAASPETSAASLLTDAEFEALRHDPVALRAAFERAARGAVDPRERVLIDALREDPQGTVRAIAEKLGLTIAEAKQVAKAASEEPKKGNGKFSPSEQLQAKLNEVFGPNLAPRFVPVIQELIESLVESTYGSRISEIQSAFTQQQEAANLRAIEAQTEAFYVKNPEARAFASDMDKLAERVAPNTAMGVEEYMGMLWAILQHQNGSAETLAAERLQRGAKAAATVPRGAGGGAVRRVPIGKVSFEKAAELAMKGVRISR